MKELCIFEKGVKNGWTVDIFPKFNSFDEKVNTNGTYVSAS